MEDRGVLSDSEWKSNTVSYLKQLGCPYGFGKFPNAALDWLLGYAVKIEYSNQKDSIKYVSLTRTQCTIVL